MFAKSLAGHDHGILYIICELEKEYVYLTDGKRRSLANPKKKKIKHVQIDYNISELLTQMTAKGQIVRDEDIRKALKLKTKETN